MSKSDDTSVAAPSTYLEELGALKALAAVALLAGLVWPAESALAKDVNCKCPKVPATGYGSSSCSANESGGFCRVEFNEFPVEILQRVSGVYVRAKVQTRLPPSQGPGGPAPDQAQALAQLPDDERVKVVLVYLGVAAARGGDVFNENIAAALGDAFTSADVKREVAQAFGEAPFKAAMAGWPSAAPIPVRPKPFPGGRARVLVAPGCVSVELDSHWFMYKAFWSGNRLLPQCGEP